MENLVELLKLALAFYANPENYNHPELNDGGLVQSDGGNQARFALDSIDKYYNSVNNYDDLISELKDENISLSQLRAVKEETISRWEKLGLLEGLTGNVNENVASLYEGQLSYVINDEELNELKKEEND